MNYYEDNNLQICRIGAPYGGTAGEGAFAILERLLSITIKGTHFEMAMFLA